MNRLIISALLSGMLVTGVPCLVHADAKVTMVDGYIERVSDDSIVVNFKRYYLAGAALRNIKDEPVNMTELRVGRKVEIFFHDRRIDCILIYPENWAE
jgi:hypothetical protein